MGYNGSNRTFKSNMFSKRTSRAEKGVIKLLSVAALLPLSAVNIIGNNATTPLEENPPESRLKNWQALLLSLICLIVDLIIAFCSIRWDAPMFLTSILVLIDSVAFVYFLFIPIDRYVSRKHQERMIHNNQLEKQELRMHLESKSAALYHHEVSDHFAKGIEAKNYYQSGFSPQDMGLYDSQTGVHFAYAWTPSFGRMVFTDNDYFVAFFKHPEKFGTGDAFDIITALYEEENAAGRNMFDWEISDYVEYWRIESCCYAVPKIEGSFSDDFLRIDLFRMINPKIDNPREKEFVGGLFHVLDHFAFNGRNLGTGTDTYDVQSVEKVIQLCMEAFACKHMLSEEEALSFIILDDTHRLKIAFYREKESGAFYIKTAHPLSIESTTRHDISSSPAV